MHLYMLAITVVLTAKNIMRELSRRCVVAVPYRRATELMLLNAACPNTPAHVLEQLSIEDDPRLLEHIAENPNTPVITLGYLAGHRDSRVRVAVTHNH